MQRNSSAVRPIREAANRDELCAAVADGTIDVIVSDQSPCTPELKRLDIGDFAAAWRGTFRCNWGCRPSGPRPACAVTR